METYRIYIFVKPYVRKFLLDSYRIRTKSGEDIIDIRPDRLLYRQFIAGLTKEPPAVQKPGRYRTCRIAVRVSEDTILRHGHRLTAAADSQINTTLELRCRNIMLTYISTIYLLTGNLARAIQIFYDRTGYDEDSWPTDSIRKIWQRESFLPKKTFFDDILEKFSDFILGKLSHD